MANFVYTKQGQVNLDHVAKTATNVKGETLLYDKAGEILGTAIEEIHGGPIIPGSSGQSAVIITVYDEDGRPAEDDIVHQYVPIIAWRICPSLAGHPSGYGIPILAEDVSSNQCVFVEFPDGKLCSASDRTYDNLDKAKEDILNEFQRLWDQRQAKREKDG